MRLACCFISNKPRTANTVMFIKTLQMDTIAVRECFISSKICKSSSSVRLPSCRSFKRSDRGTGGFL
ncbi:hypothetical protein PUN28_013876 [Cardiocondyla obscurior]|uniref:Uncharacterized protein n=1 Tax=Cardiocondyla obscurior TaxID=286306 RepID=A0AAW2F4Z9_9HYME